MKKLDYEPMKLPEIPINMMVLKETFIEYITWYKINEEDDLPKKGLWFLCKIRGSDDLSLIIGFENVIFEKYDAWAEVEAPF